MSTLKPFRVDGLTEEVAFVEYAKISAELEHRKMQTVTLDDSVRRPTFQAFYGKMHSITPDGCLQPALHFWTAMSVRDLLAQLSFQ